jgi:hypothetical protein
VQLLTRAQLDGRSHSAKLYDRLVVDIEADLGGRSQLSTIEVELIRAFAGCAIIVNHLNAKLLILEDGEEDHVDPVRTAQQLDFWLGLIPPPASQRPARNAALASSGLSATPALRPGDGASRSIQSPRPLAA